VCRPTVISSWSSRQVTEQTPSLATGREVHAWRSASGT
jgi:hypothetical protein